MQTELANQIRSNIENGKGNLNYHMFCKWCANECKNDLILFDLDKTTDKMLEDGLLDKKNLVSNLDFARFHLCVAQSFLYVFYACKDAILVELQKITGKNVGLCKEPSRIPERVFEILTVHYSNKYGVHLPHSILNDFYLILFGIL